MNNKEEFIVDKIIADIKLNYLSKLDWLEKLSACECNLDKSYSVYQDGISECKELTLKENELYDKLSERKEYLLYADKKVCNRLSNLKNNFVNGHSEDEYSYIRMCKQIESRLALFKEGSFEKVSEVINDLQMYEIDMGALYFLNKYILNDNPLTKLDLIKTKYMISFIRTHVEEYMIDNNYEAPKEMLLFSDYYVNKLKFTSILFKVKQEEVLIDTIIDYINYLDRFSVFDMLNVDVKVEINTRLSYIKSMALKIPVDVINSILYNHEFSNELIGKIVKSNLRSALEEKDKVLKVKEIHM